jgi:tubulin polyglutamylase TTLL4
MGIDYDKVFEKIKDVIIKSIISIEPIIVNNLNRSSKNRHLCFELYGFDVILDSELKPWLLEVNVLPSLSSSSPLDKKIKTSLLSDIFNTLGVIPFTKKRLLKE